MIRKLLHGNKVLSKVYALTPTVILGMLQDFLYFVSSVTQHVRSISFYRKGDVVWPGLSEFEAVCLAQSLDLRLTTYPSA